MRSATVTAASVRLDIAEAAWKQEILLGWCAASVRAPMAGQGNRI
jgi:hypothetical protein